jgi:hypothetical protein
VFLEMNPQPAGDQRLTTPSVRVLAFGDPLLLWQKQAKPSVPAKLGGCGVAFGGWAGAAAVLFLNTGRPRTVAGNFPVMNWFFD